MATVIVDALDAVELIEILGYLTERLDVLADVAVTTLVFNQYRPYDINHLRADLARLIHHLNTSPCAP